MANDRGRFRLGPALGRRQGRVEARRPSAARERRFGRVGQHRFSRGLAGNLAPARTGHRQQPPPEVLSRQRLARRPGDWESPITVSFLAIGPGHTFCFALSKRRGDVSDDLLEHARQWLLGALVHEGAGAKTAAGYGGFKPCEGDAPKLASPSREAFETTLELVTPAFLAGANQEAADCQLRTATLRGLLRWWWRTMHAGFVDVATLRRLEAVVWGDVNTGGAVRVTVEPQTAVYPVCTITRTAYDRSRIFQRQHQLQPPPNKTAQGLFYASYGMDDGATRKSGTTWSRARGGRSA